MGLSSASHSFLKRSKTSSWREMLGEDLVDRSIVEHVGVHLYRCPNSILS